MYKTGDERLRVTVRLRPVSHDESEAFPPPWPVQPADGEVRIYAQRPLRTGTPSSPRAALSPRLATTKYPQEPHHHPARSLEEQQALQQLCGDYQAYTFGAVFGPQASDDDVYEGSGCRDIVESACQGCNGTTLLYGQAGSGKTHTHEAITRAAVATIFGPALESSGRELAAFGVSVVEIGGNEHIRCLLSGGDVMLRQGHRGEGVILEGAREQACSSEDEALAIIAAARARRAVGERRGNAHSSRSHLVVRIRLEVLELAAAPGGGAACGAARGVAFGVLNLVDLAGAERVERSCESKALMREALNINKSLLCLGNVVNALAERGEGKKVHVPYRDSKLTRLLEDALGGSARTALIACITPLPGHHLEQTRATLEFAARAGQVVCSPQRNLVALEAPSESMQRVLAMTSELERLRQALAAQSAECEVLRAQLGHAAGHVGPLEKLTARISAKLGGGSTGGRRISADGAISSAAAAAGGGRRCSSAAGHREGEAPSPLMWRVLQAEHSDAGGGGSTASTPAPDGSLDAWMSFAGQQGRVWRHVTLGGLGLAADLDTIGEACGLGPASVAGATAPLSARQLHLRGAESDGGVPYGCGARAPAVQVLQSASLREHIMRMLVALLQQKKAEARALKQRAGRLGAQLTAAKEQQGEQEARLGSMMDGILRLGAARREEFARWSGHLQGLEEGLLEAQREALAYRDEAVALQQQLAEVEARCRRQEEQLTLAAQTTLKAGQACSDGKGDAAVPLAVCLAQLFGVHELLQEALAHGQSHGAAGGSLTPPGSAASGQLQLMQVLLPQVKELLDSAERLAVAGYAGDYQGTTACSECEAAKPLLAFMHKLREEVALCREALRQRDALLAASSEAVEALRSELEVEKARVASLEEKVRQVAPSADVSDSSAARGGGRRWTPPGVDECAPLEQLHFKILEAWTELAVPHSLRAAVVLHPSWQQRSQCAAHLALLGCLRELYAAEPGQGARAAELLHQEDALISAGLAALSTRELAAACSTFGIAGGDASAQQRRLMERLWAASRPSVAGAVAAASSAVCWATLKRNPAEALCSSNLTGAGHVVAAVGAALQVFVLGG